MKPFFKILTLTLLVLTAAGCGGGAGDCKLSLGGLSCQSEPTPNSPPVASAGADQSGPLNTEFTLNASASLDANRDPLSYSWQMTSKPSGSQAALSSTSVPKPVFTADKVGIYEFTVEVSDGQSSTSASTRVTVAAANIVPQAIAGATQSVRVGDTVTLDGKDSSDANTGDVLTYIWSLAPPAGSKAALDVPNFVRPQFKPDVPGIYMASLIVSDGKSSSAPAVTRIDVSAVTVNAPPVARVGADQNVLRGTVVLLDGSTSSDANQDPLQYSWTISYKPPTSTLQAVDLPNSPITKFTPDVAGNYVFALTVSDGKASSTTTTSVTAVLGNSAPVAAVTQNAIAGLTGRLITLDGSPSLDSNGDPLSYRWTLVAPPVGSALNTANSPSNPTSAISTFTPDVNGTYVFSLKVSDGKLSSDAVNVVVTASNLNLPPTAQAGPDQSVITGTPVILNGTTSQDPNGDPLTYTWALVARPTASNNANQPSNMNTAKPVFTPDADGVYVFSLTVNDGKVNSVVDYTRVTASAANAAPVAVARTATPSVLTGSTVILDATQSSDSNRDTISYKWTVISAPVSPLPSLAPNDATPLPTFVASVPGTYVFGLTVSDGRLTSSLTTLAVVATDRNAAPVALAGSDISVNTGSSVSLNGTASRDANNDRLTYKWIMQSSPTGSTARLFGDTSDKPSFVADKSGLYVISLVVNDGLLDSTMAFVTVTASTTNLAPTADAGPPLTATQGGSVMLDGTASSDPQGNALTYSWYMIGPAQGSNIISIPSPSSSRTAFVPDVAGVYVIGLTVNNGRTTSRPAVVTVTVN